MGNATDINQYKYIFPELTVVNGLIMRGERIVIPEKMRKHMVKIAHEGHQGIVRTKQVLRAHVWFPGIDAIVKKYIAKCMGCQAATPSTDREPLEMTELPT